jgi:hypothetical protein
MEQQPLSNNELGVLLGLRVQDIIKYSDLGQFETMDDLFKYGKPYRIILIETEPNRGHWVCALKVNGNFYYFNSYGKAPDRDLNTIPRLLRKCLGQDSNEFRRLIGDGDLWYNKHKFQKDKTQTCGRWCALVCTLAAVGYEGPEIVEYLVKHKVTDANICEFVNTRPRTNYFTSKGQANF